MAVAFPRAREQSASAFTVVLTGVLWGALAAACDALPGTEGAECGNGLCVSGFTCLDGVCEERDVWEHWCEAADQCLLLPLRFDDGTVVDRDRCEEIFRLAIRELPPEQAADCIRELSACASPIECSEAFPCDFPSCIASP